MAQNNEELIHYPRPTGAIILGVILVTALGISTLWYKPGMPSPTPSVPSQSNDFELQTTNFTYQYDGMGEKFAITLPANFRVSEFQTGSPQLLDHAEFYLARPDSQYFISDLHIRLSVYPSNGEATTKYAVTKATVEGGTGTISFAMLNVDGAEGFRYREQAYGEYEQVVFQKNGSTYTLTFNCGDGCTVPTAIGSQILDTLLSGFSWQ